SAPIVTGIAALILEYYPKLSALQVKDAIMQSVTPLKGLMVYKPATRVLVDFTTLSKTGGIVNAYRALEIASKMKGERRCVAGLVAETHTGGQQFTKNLHSI